MQHYFFFQEPSLTTTNGGPRAIFQCNYLAKFLQIIDEFFYVQLHLGFGGPHHPDLAGAGALVRVLPGEFNTRSEKNKKFLSSIAFSSIQSYVTRHLHLSPRFRHRTNADGKLLLPQGIK